MVKFRLGATQKLRLRTVLKVNGCRLRQLRARPRRSVIASNAFTGESKQFEASCVEELRKVIDIDVPFVTLRLFHNNVELSDFDDIEAEVTFVREPNPIRALVYLDRMDLRVRGWPGGDPAWSKDDTTSVKEIILALRKMDLLPHQVGDIYSFAIQGAGIEAFPGYILSDMGIIIGQACVDSKLEMAFIMEGLPLRDDRMCEWFLHTVKEITSQRPAILAPYVTGIIKAMVPYWVEYAQIEVDKLTGAIWRAEHVAIIEYLTRIKSAPLVNSGYRPCFMDWFPKNCAILDALCQVQWASEVIRCGNDAF